ncbi:MAG: STAS domain-containing protein, partial [Gammaproteobacteria bacterium]|nr:STAS domain-containing protein [Gammaproteobacteria bacterium]
RSHGITVVGAIPAGLPDPGITLPSRAQLEALVLPALSIGLIGFVESVSVARSLGMRRGERIDPDAELRGLGAANLAAGLSAGFPVAGGLSRSIVNFSAGARTRMAGVYAALLMLGVVAFLTQAFAQLAHTVLAAAIILPALGLVDLRILREAWSFSRSDAWAYIGTAVGVMVLGIEIGILCGVIFSLVTIQWQASNPHLAEIGRVPGTTHYRNVKRSAVVTYPHVLAIRVDGDFFFGNVRPVTAQIEQALTARPGVTHLVLDLSSVNRVDLTGLEGLRELNHSLRARRVTLHLAEVKGPVLDRLERSHLLQELARAPFRFLHEAFVALNATH